MFVGRINGEGAGVLISIGLTGVHAITTSANSRSANRVVEICMRLKKSFIWYAQNLTGGLTVCVTCAGAGTAKPSSQKNDKA